LIETLTCANCGASWVRESARGRKPKLCGVCRGTTTTTAVRKEAKSEEVRARLDDLDHALMASNSHLSQQPAVRKVYSLYDLDDRLTAVEQSLAALLAR
jgi:hypothetical protein